MKNFAYFTALIVMSLSSVGCTLPEKPEIVVCNDATHTVGVIVDPPAAAFSVGSPAEFIALGGKILNPGGKGRFTVSSGKHTVFGAETIPAGAFRSKVVEVGFPSQEVIDFSELK